MLLDTVTNSLQLIPTDQTLLDREWRGHSTLSEHLMRQLKVPVAEDRHTSDLVSYKVLLNPHSLTLSSFVFWLGKRSGPTW